MFLSAWISAGAASGAGAHPTWGATGLALSPEKECGIHLITSLRMQEAVLPSEAVEMSGRSQGRFFLSAGVAGIQAGQSRTLVLPPTTVSLAPGQAGAAQLPKETHPQGTDRAFCKPKFEMKVLDILQHVKTLYKPFSHLAAMQDLLQTLPGVQSCFCREWCFPVGFSPQAGGWSGRKRICATSPF